MTAMLSSEFKNVLGSSGWLVGSDAKSFTTDWLDRYNSTPIGIARPANTEQVAEVVKLCQRYGVTVTPQGGNTGMVGGAVPTAVDDRPSIIVQMGRMNSVISVDSLGRTAVVEAGVVLEQLHERLLAEQLHLPMHLGSQGSAQIGGLLSTNAGGSHVLRYGMMQELVLGLEVVLPDGQIWTGTRSLLKDNTGYPLKRLFCGAEGTLGVITRASLRLVPAPFARVSALLSCDSVESALKAAARIRSDAGDLVSALEFLTTTSFDFVQKHLPEIVVPLDDIPAVALLVEIETSSPYIDVDGLFHTIMEELLNGAHFTDGVIASNEAQRLAFWRIREEIPEAQRREGLQLKHDVAVPVVALADFINTATTAVMQIQPGVRVNAFGHLGDGNVHFNLSPPAGEAGFGECEGAHRQAVYDAALAHSGTISAEHGLGQDKVVLANHYYSDTERGLMRTLKAAFDPNNVMNPGKVV